MLQLKRAYEPPAPDDGKRILVDRLWPRGVSKEKLKIENWARSIAPSTPLREWFAHDPVKWNDFKRRYFAELQKNPDGWKFLVEEARKGRLTLVYSAKDIDHNDAVALKEFLESKMGERQVRKLIILILAAVLSLSGAAAGCSRSPDLKLIMPTSNSFAIGDVTVAVDVLNFKVADKQGQAAVKGEGHLHYFMDVDAPTTPGKPAVTEPGTWATTIATKYTWHNVGGGSHTFSVELVNNDHTPLNPPVVIRKTILVIPEIGLPQAVILSPRDGAVLPAGDITIRTQVANFNLVDKIGQPSVSHEGHLIYFIDLEPPYAGLPAAGVSSSEDSYNWKGVGAGGHTFTIELVNNDNSVLDPPVMVAIAVIVQ